MEEQKPEAQPQQPEPQPDKLSLIEQRLLEMEQRLKSQDKAIGRKEAENQRLKESLEGRETDQSLTKALIATLASQLGKPTDEFESEIRQKEPDLVKQYESLEKKRQSDLMAQKFRDYQQRAVDAGLTEENPDYWAVYGALVKGNYGKADSLLDKVETEKNKPPESPKEVPKETPAELEVKRKKEIEEEARKMLESRGQLKTETGGPSAPGKAVYTLKEVQAMPSNEYLKAFPNGYIDVVKGLKEGKIKE